MMTCDASTMIPKNVIALMMGVLVYVTFFLLAASLNNLNELQATDILYSPPE